MKIQLILIFTLLFGLQSYCQVTNIVILDKNEISHLQEVISTNRNAKQLYDSIAAEAAVALQLQPRPLQIMYYEGLLDTNPKRINTVKSFADINNVVTLIYANYGNENSRYGEKTRQIIMAWANTYKSDGNTINENKFNAFFWGYYLFKNHFTTEEQQQVENWMNKIAVNQMNRKRTPNNNWEAKRLKIIGIIGCILQNEKFIKYSVNGYKKFISSAYFPNGTSNDLRQRDALHYHVSGLKPCLSAFINLSKFNPDFNLYNWESPNGSSIKKAVEFVVPYATGDKTREEWKNSKVELDKKRAAAGIAKYQPGMLFDPQKAYPMLEWACYYNPEWFSVFENKNKEKYTSTWIGLLNSPLVRKN